MPSTIERAVRPSLLDRLMGSSGDGAAGAGGFVTWAESVQHLKASLLRDLERLLNTRRTIEVAPDSLPEVCRSLYHYGLPDISSMSSDSPEVRHRLVRELEQLIRTFEPRLTAARVSLADEGGGDRKIRFVIDALLKLDPTPERVIFDTVLEISSGEFVVGEHA